MEKFYTSETIMAVVAVMGVISFLVHTAAAVKKLFAKPTHQEPVTRGEYEKDEAVRGERHSSLMAKSISHEEKFDDLITSITDLRVEVATLTATLKNPQGDCSCRKQPPPLPPSSSLLPRPSRAS